MKKMKFEYAKTRKNYENKQTHNILVDKYYICAIHNLCVLNPGGLSRNLKTFLGVVTMNQVIPRVLVKATMVDLHPTLPPTYISILLAKNMRKL